MVAISHEVRAAPRFYAEFGPLDDKWKTSWGTGWQVLDRNHPTSPGAPVAITLAIDAPTAKVLAAAMNALANQLS